MASANGCFPLFSRSHGKRVGYFGFRRETAGQRFGGNYDGTLVDESESAGVPPTHSREMSQRNGRAYSAAFWQRIRICRDTSVFRATSGRVLAKDTDLSRHFRIPCHFRPRSGREYESVATVLYFAPSSRWTGDESADEPKLRPPTHHPAHRVRPTGCSLGLPAW